MDDGGRQGRPVTHKDQRRGTRRSFLELKNTINIDGRPAVWVRRRGHTGRQGSVGTEGKLGGQAGGEGRVRALGATSPPSSVNSMADNLTDQVRNIAQVTTAVAQGDLSQKITVDARGEILELKNTINKMV